MPGVSCLPTPSCSAWAGGRRSALPPPPPRENRAPPPPKRPQPPAALADTVHPLAEPGVDISACSPQACARPEFEGSPRGFAGWVKRLTGRPVIAVGGVGFSYAATDRERRRAIQTRMRLLLQLMQAGEFDLIAVGRALLADAEWAAKVRRGDWSDIIPWQR